MRRLRKLGQVLLGIVVIAVIPSVLAEVFRADASFQDLIKHYRYSLIYTFCIGAPSWVVMPRLAPRLLRASSLVRIPALIGLLAVLAVAGSLAANFVFLGIGWLDPKTFWPEFAYGMRIAVIMTVLLGATSTSVEVLRSRLQAAREELRTRQQEDERARQLVTQARLSSLESRIHPHFLFNTLNSISALIREDPRKAERTVERLAALLRYSLDNNRGLVPLRQELHVVEDYLEIEKTRFGDRLRFTLDVPPDVADLDVPPLALQTLVENSIKHAVAPNRQGGEIGVAARLESSGCLLVEVSDDGPGFERSSIHQGHGLENLQERLTALFDGEGRLEMARRDGRMVVGIAVPQKKVLA
jgi:two-component system LytT family sensor kinase